MNVLSVCFVIFYRLVSIQYIYTHLLQVYSLFLFLVYFFIYRL